MKNKKRLAILAGVLMTMSVAAGTVVMTTSGCAPETAVEQGMELSGTYYVDSQDGSEYNVSFAGNTYKFTFSVGGATREGTYSTPDGVSITLVFSDDGSAVTATLNEGVLSFTYGGAQYSMLEKIEYTVTFDLGGGTGTGSAKVVNGRALQKPAAPTKGESVFVGWYADAAFTQPYSFDTAVTGDITLYARFVDDISVETEFTVSFDSSTAGGTAFDSVQTVGRRIYADQLPEPELGEATFLGWWTSDYQDPTKLTARVEDGQEIAENTTLYAVWARSDRPTVSVTKDGLEWNAMGVSASYSVTITGPDGKEFVTDRTVQANSLPVDFLDDKYPAGDYEIKVTYNGQTSTAYYRNKGLARVTVFKVEGTTLFFNEVENAQHYYLTYYCGTTGHTHKDIDLGTATHYDFSELGCDMAPRGMDFSVRAEAEGYVQSTSPTFNFERSLAAVQSVSVDAATDFASWDAVPNAQSYNVVVTAGGDEYVYNNLKDTKLDLQQFYGNIKVSVTPVAYSYNSPVATVCDYNKTRLATPENIKASGNDIVWDAVEGCTGYIVTINGQKFDVTGTSFDVAAHDVEAVNNAYSVTVQAVAADPANNSFGGTGTIALSLTDLKYANGKVSWNSVIGVTEYQVRLNGDDENIITVEDATSAAVTFTREGNNTIEVRFMVGGEPSGQWQSVTVSAGALTFSKNDNTGEQSVYYYAVGDTITLPEATRTGYSFIGWFTQQESGQQVTTGATFNGETTYYAHWSANEYTVVFIVPNTEGEFSDGSNSMMQTVRFGEQFKWPVPESLDGAKAFGGWFSDSGSLGYQYSDPEGNGTYTYAGAETITVYPHWLEAFEYVQINHPNNPGEYAYSVFKGEGIDLLREVTVPAMYNGLPVVRIEGSCFQFCDDLEVINIPDSILTVFTGDEGANSTGSAFYSCDGLKEVNIYDASDQVDGNYPIYYRSENGALLYDNPYTGQTELAFVPLGITGTFRVPDGVEVLPIQVFKDSNVSEIIIPASVTRIGYRAFYNTDEATKITFLEAEEGVEEVPLTVDAGTDYNGKESKQIFYSCDSLVEITFPARLEEFTSEYISSCNLLERVNFVGEDGNYTSHDGVVLSADSSTIIYCPAGRTSYVIPSMVRNIGERAFYKCTKLTSIGIPTYIENIGKEAFRDCTGLLEIIFSGTGNDNPLSIAEYAFYGCNKVTELVLPENLQKIEAHAFGNMSKLTTVTVNVSREDINYSNGAFLNDSNGAAVSTLIIGPKVPVLDINAIFGSTALTNVVLDDANTNYEAIDGVLFDSAVTRIIYFPKAKGGEYVIPDTVKGIAASVFRGRNELEGITIPASVSEIGDSAFENCYSLEYVTFLDAAEGVEAATTLTIGARAFLNCSLLVEVDLPGRLTYIGDEAFKGCSDIVSIVIPEGVTELGHAVFDSCISLETVSLPSTLIKMGMYSTEYEYHNYLTSNVAELGVENIDVFANCTALVEIIVSEDNNTFAAHENVLYGKNEDGKLATLYFSPMYNTGDNGVITVPSTVNKIMGRAFYNAMAVSTIKFEARTDGGTFTMGVGVFQSDDPSTSKLERIELPVGMTEIGKSMFENSALREVFIPNTIRTIGARAFFGCSNLTTVEFEEGGTEALVIADGEYDTVPVNQYANKTLYYGVFGGTAIKEIAFPARTTQIGNFAFMHVEYDPSLPYDANDITSQRIGLSVIEKVTIPSSLTRIGVKAFGYSLNLKQFILEGTAAEGSLTIESGAFEYSGIENISLPATTSVIQSNAFQRSAIVSINIPKNVTEIGTEGTLSSSQGGYTVGGYAFAYCSNLKTVTFEEGCQAQLVNGSNFYDCSSLTSINLEACTSLKELPQNTFSGCSSLSSLKIPASVTYVGNRFVDGCKALTSIEFMTAANEDGRQEGSLEEVGDYAFAGSGLVELAFPESSSEITLGNKLFERCYELTTVHLSTSVTDIGTAFASAPNISTITVAEGNPAYKGAGEGVPLILSFNGNTIVKAYRAVTSEGDSGEYVIPEGMTDIGANAFYGQMGIKKLVLPASLMSIGEYAFSGCLNLEEIVIPENSSLSQIGDYAFLNCVSLKEISLPSIMKSIGRNAFEACISLEKAVLPTVVDNLGTGSYSWYCYIFRDCFSLREVNVPAISGGYFDEDGDLINYYGNMFEDCTALTKVTLAPGVTALTGSMFLNCTSLESIDLSNVTYIGSSAFSGCSSLKTVVDISKVTTILSSAFKNCTSLTSVKMDAVTELGTSAFEGSGLTSVTIPESLTKLVNYTVTTPAVSSASSIFLNCEKLTTVTLHDKLTAIGASTFRGCVSLKTINYLDTAKNVIVGEEGWVTLPESLTVLGNAAFGRYTSSTTKEEYKASGIEKARQPHKAL